MKIYKIKVEGNLTVIKTITNIIEVLEKSHTETLHHVEDIILSMLPLSHFTVNKAHLSHSEGVEYYATITINAEGKLPQEPSEDLVELHQGTYIFELLWSPKKGMLQPTMVEFIPKYRVVDISHLLN